jgi:hypothetical protein
MAEDYSYDILKELQSINKKMSFLIAYVQKAESEVPEYIRRHTMYVHDLLLAKRALEDLGLHTDPIHGDEIDRSIKRLCELIEREQGQGGAFHETSQRLAQHREKHGKAYKHGAME